MDSPQRNTEESPDGKAVLAQQVADVLLRQKPEVVQCLLEFFSATAPSEDSSGQRPTSFDDIQRVISIQTGPATPPTGQSMESEFSPITSPVPQISVAGDSLRLRENVGVEPHPRDLDVTDPASIETSLTAIHRSIDFGYELQNIIRSTGSLGSLASLHTSWEEASNDERSLRAVSPLSRSLSSAIFQRRLAFRAKKEEFYPETDRDPLVVVTVGLPARGKSYVARRLCRYMGWKGVPCRIYNAGNYRRVLLGNDQHADFFDAKNTEAKALREKMAQMAADDLIDYIRSGGQVGIFDATNTTRNRRRHVLEVFTRELGLHMNRVIFLEMVCHDPKLVEHNILEVKLRGKDYEGVDATAAYADFKNREAEYMKVYESLDLNHIEDRKLSFIQLVDAGESLVAHRIVGALPRSIMQFAGHLKPFAGHLYVTVSGDTPDTIGGRLGVDSDLAPSGKEFAVRLETWASRQNYEIMHVWCAPTRAGQQTAQPFLKKKKKYHVQVWRALMDMDYGKYQGKTYYEVQHNYPKVWAALEKDEYFYTWPGGESPCNVVQRLDPILMAMECKTAPILIVCTRTVCRAILSYCCDLIPEQFTRIKLPKNMIFDIDMNAEPVKVTMQHV